MTNLISETSKFKKLNIVDFLRGFSIFTIVIMHLLQQYPISPLLMKASSLCGAGVHVFILCSGFGLYLSYLRKPISYKNFLQRRFLKIYIPYLFIILLSAIIPFYNTSSEKWIELLSHVLLFKMFIEEWECSYGGQFWFISTIIQFYLFWPIIIKLFYKGGIILSLFISLTWATFIVYWELSEYRIWNSFFLQYLWEFVLGMWLAKYFNKNSILTLPSYKYLTPICIISLIIYGLTGYYGGLLKSYNDIPSLLGYLSIALIIYKISIKSINHFFIFTNKVSYEWYLIHYLIFGCCNHYLQQTNTPIIIQASISLILSYIFAIIYHQTLHKLKFI